MRKILLLLTVFLGSRFAGHSQPQAYQAKTEYQKVQQDAAAIDLSYPTDMVEQTIKEQMAKKGMKGTNQKGFTLYHGIRLGDTASTISDLFFKVDRRNRDKNASTVTLVVVMAGEDPAKRAPGAPFPFEGAKALLNNLVPAFEASDLELQIQAQETVVKKAQKKYNGLQDDQSDLEKKIRNAQSDLDQNKKDQIQATADMQANIHGDNDAMKKAQKKMNKLLDEQSSLEKKIRNWQAALAQNKTDQAAGLSTLQNQQQALDSMKAKRKS
jgi:ribosomal protein L13E